MATIGFLLLPLHSIFLFLIFISEMATSRETFPSIQCSNTKPKISYPFGIKDIQSEGVRYGNSYNPGYNLTCNVKGETVIDNLPFLAGKFLVRNINYHSQEIQIQDPSKCLARRYLQDLNGAFDTAVTSPSLLKAYAYQMHTFFSCSSASMATNINRYSAYFRTVSCLSSSTHTVLVTVSTSNNVNLNINKILMDSGYCEVIDHISIPIPNPLYGDVYDLTKDDLFLSWGATPPLRRDLQEAVAPGQDNSQVVVAPTPNNGNNAADSPSSNDGSQGGGDAKQDADAPTQNNGNNAADSPLPNDGRQGGGSGGGGGNKQGGGSGGGGGNGQGGGGSRGGGDNGEGDGSGGGGDKGQGGSTGGGNSMENIIIGAICGGVGVIIIVLVLVCCCNNRKVWNMTVDLILLGLNVVANLHGCGCYFTVFMRCIKRKGPNLHGIDQVMQ